MKVTRYFQSCLLIEEGSARILLDASADDAGRFNEFGKLDALLYTHEHGDHFDPDLAQKFADAGVAVYANASTAKQMKSQPTVVADGQEFDLAGLKIKAIELPHCPMPNGSAGPQNTGYFIGGKLFDPGDGKELNGLKVEVMALPITGPDISMRDAFAFGKQLGVNIAIPVHYDKLGANPEVYAAFLGYFPDDFDFAIKPLELGESLEI